MKNHKELDQRMINKNCENKPIRMKILQSEPNHAADKNEETKLYSEAYKSPIRFLLDTLDPGYIEYKGVDIELLTKYCKTHKDNICKEKVQVQEGSRDLSTIIEIIGAIGKNKNDDLKPLQKQMLSSLAEYVSEYVKLYSSFRIEVNHSIVRNYSTIMNELDSASLTKLSHMFKQGEHEYRNHPFQVAGNQELNTAKAFLYESGRELRRGDPYEDKIYDFFGQKKLPTMMADIYTKALSAMNHQLIANGIIEGTIKKILDNNKLTTDQIEKEIITQVKQPLEQKGWNHLAGLDGYQGKIKSFFSEPTVQKKLAELASEMSKIEVKEATNKLEQDKKQRFNDKEFCGEYCREYRNGNLINNEGNTVYRDVLSYLTLGISSLIFELLDYLGITESCYQAAKKNAIEQDATATIELKKPIGKEAFGDLLPIFLNPKQNEEKQPHPKEEGARSQTSGQTQPSAPPHEEEGTPRPLVVSNPQKRQYKDSELAP